MGIETKRASSCTKIGMAIFKNNYTFFLPKSTVIEFEKIKLKGGNNFLQDQLAH